MKQYKLNNKTAVCDVIRRLTKIGAAQISRAEGISEWVESNAADLMENLEHAENCEPVGSVGKEVWATEEVPSRLTKDGNPLLVDFRFVIIADIRTSYKIVRLFDFRPAEGTWKTMRESLVDAESDIAADIQRRRGYAVKIELFGANGRACGDNTTSGTMLVTRT